MINVSSVVEANLAAAALQGVALQQAAAANRALYLRNPIAQALAVRNLQGLGVQGQLAALGAQQQQFPFIAPALAAQLQSQGLLLGAAASQLPQTAQQVQPAYDPAALLTEQARLQLAAAQAANPLVAAAAARNVAVSGGVNGAATTNLGEQYLGSALTAALPGYPAVAATYRALNRFTPY
uniref:Chorion protein n=1 Tax=Syphacia muris TaxID=451379 RepID=A0A0N5AXX0_9BILA